MAHRFLHSSDSIPPEDDYYTNYTSTSTSSPSQSQSQSQSPNSYGIYGNAVEYWLQHAVFFIGASCVSLACHSLLLAAAVLGEDGKTRRRVTFYALIAVYAVAKMFVCSSTVVFGVFQIVGRYRPHILTMSRWRCFATLATVVCSDIYSFCVMLLVAVDRAVAVARPTRYGRLIATPDLLRALLGLLLLVAGIVVVGVAQERASDGGLLDVVCTNPLRCYVTLYLLVVSWAVVAVGVCTVLVYATIMIYISWRARHMVVSMSYLKEARLTKSIAWMMVVYTISFIMVPFVRFFSLFFDISPALANTLLIYSNRFTYIERIADPLLIVYRSSELKLSVRKILLGKMFLSQTNVDKGIIVS